MKHDLTFMAVHAHPDDEALGTGGVLARYSSEGIKTVLVTCTRGEVGEINDPSMDPETTRARLGDIRTEELQRAGLILGISHVEILGYRDSGMMGTDDNNHPASFWQANSEEATGRLVRLVRTHRPDVIVTYDENGNYGHPDHIAAHRTAVAAFHAAGDSARFPEYGPAPWQPKKLYSIAWSAARIARARDMMRERGIKFPWEPDNPEEFEEWGTPPDRITAEIDVRDHLPKKWSALSTHRTQIGPDSFFRTLPQDIAEVMAGWESFIRIRCLIPAPDHEDDLFAGLRSVESAARDSSARSDAA